MVNMGNAIIGQSGGPSAVINSSLAGFYNSASTRGIKKIYGMRHGLEGFISGNYVDMSDFLKNEHDIELLKRTPAAYLGSCRYKLPSFEIDEEPYEKIFALLKKLDIKFFFYIGGNDSMDSIEKLSSYAQKTGAEISFMGIPKTIDNDLAVTDHTPGFGSAAKYVSTTLKEVIRDGNVYPSKSITIVEIMGRHAGWLTASSALTRTYDCQGPDMIILPELEFDMDNFLEKVSKMHQERKSLLIAVSEGIKSDGKFVCDVNKEQTFVDAFGHAALSGTASVLAGNISRVTGCKTRAIEFSTMQRCASHVVSGTDVQEAYLAGGRAVDFALMGQTHRMVIFRRVSSNPYEIVLATSDISLIANVEKKLPLNWITDDGTFLTEDFFEYCRPLIRTELLPFMVDGIPQHLVPLPKMN